MIEFYRVFPILFHYWRKTIPAVRRGQGEDLLLKRTTKFILSDR